MSLYRYYSLTIWRVIWNNKTSLQAYRSLQSHTFSQGIDYTWLYSIFIPWHMQVSILSVLSNFTDQVTLHSISLFYIAIKIVTFQFYCFQTKSNIVQVLNPMKLCCYFCYIQTDSKFAIRPSEWIVLLRIHFVPTSFWPTIFSNQTKSMKISFLPHSQNE